MHSAFSLRPNTCLVNIIHYYHHHHQYRYPPKCGRHTWGKMPLVIFVLVDHSNSQNLHSKLDYHPTSWMGKGRLRRARTFQTENSLKTEALLPKSRIPKELRLCLPSDWEFCLPHWPKSQVSFLAPPHCQAHRNKRG